MTTMQPKDVLPADYDEVMNRISSWPLAARSTLVHEVQGSIAADFMQEASATWEQQKQIMLTDDLAVISKIQPPNLSEGEARLWRREFAIRRGLLGDHDDYTPDGTITSLIAKRQREMEAAMGRLRGLLHRDPEISDEELEQWRDERRTKRFGS